VKVGIKVRIVRFKVLCSFRYLGLWKTTETTKNVSS